MEAQLFLKFKLLITRERLVLGPINVLTAYRKSGARNRFAGVPWV